MVKVKVKIAENVRFRAYVMGDFDLDLDHDKIY